MKKFIFTILLGLMGGMALTSCIEKGNGERLSTMLTIESSKDLLDACDIEITYKGEGGIDLVDTITTANWFKIIVNDSFPTEVGLVNLRYLVKPGFKPTKDFYDLDCRCELKAKEDDLRSRTYPLHLHLVAGDKVLTYLDLINIQVKETVEDAARPEIAETGLYTVERKTQAENDSTSKEYDPTTKYFKFTAK
jgi:hypothetical protein